MSGETTPGRVASSTVARFQFTREGEKGRTAARSGGDPAGQPR